MEVLACTTFDGDYSQGIRAMRRRNQFAEIEPFREFVERESVGLVAASTAIVGSRATAEEIVQDCLERTYVRWGRISSTDRPGAWVRRMVINQSISTVRRRGTERRALDKVGGLAAADRGGSTADSSDIELRDEQLWAAVRALPDDQATAVALRYAADCSLPDVAAALGVSESAANSLLFRARTSLRTQLDPVEVLT